MKKKNPFHDCKNTADVLKVIRTKCEDLRGKKFQHFIVENMRIDGELRFQLTADNTYVRRRGDNYNTNVNWFDLICGERYYYFHPNSKLGRYRGEQFDRVLKSSGGGGDGKLNWSFVSIDLKHVPHIKKLHKQNLTRAQKAVELSHKPYPYTDEDHAVQKAYDELDAKVYAWRDKNRSDYVAKFPQHVL